MESLFIHYDKLVVKWSCSTFKTGVVRRENWPKKKKNMGEGGGDAGG